LNHEWFNALTGMPIQLVRGLLACWVSFAIWGIWGQKIIQKVSAPHYTLNLRRLFAGTLTAIDAILLVGWLLTQYLGDIYERNIEAEAKSDIDLVVSYLSGTTAATAGIAEALAGAPAVRAYLSGENGVSKDWVSQLLALNIAAARAVGGAILNTEGQVIAGVGHSHSIDVSEAVFLRRALEGETSHSFDSAPPDEGISYYSVAPIYDEKDATVRGAAIIERSLKDFSNDLRTFNRPIALVEPDGDVVLTNNPAWEMKAFWPSADTTSSQKQRPSILKGVLTGSAWVQVDGFSRLCSTKLRQRWRLVGRHDDDGPGDFREPRARHRHDTHGHRHGSGLSGRPRAAHLRQFPKRTSALSLRNSPAT